MRYLSLVLVCFLSCGFALAGLKNVIVAVDAGHGGKDSGAIGAYSTLEKQVTLSIGGNVVMLLNQLPGIKAVATRQNDRYLTLRSRTQKARAYKANIFLSIHADAARSRQPSGASVYILSAKGATSEAARWLARRENATDFVNGVTIKKKPKAVASVLVNMQQVATQKNSQALASAILMTLKEEGTLHKSTVQRAAFVVLKSPDIPSVLVEVGFLTNHQDAKRLKQASVRLAIAKAIVRGVLAYLDHYAPSKTAIAAYGIPTVIRYRVQKGDTLGKIARNYHLSWQQLKQVLGLKSTVIYPGQELKIPVRILLS